MGDALDIIGVYLKHLAEHATQDALACLVSDATAPLISWASEYDAVELAEIYPEGKMSYSRPTAVRWVRLADKWRDEAPAKD